MLFEKIDRDERTFAAGGRVAGIWLGVTHILLGLYRLTAWLGRRRIEKLIAEQ